MKRIIAIGDRRPTAPYHPLENLAALPNILDGYHVELTDDRDALLHLRNYDLFLCYIDSFRVPIAQAQADALREWLQGGGRMLCVHNGLSLQSTPSLAEVVGVEFTHHPPYCTMTVTPTATHPVTAGIAPFRADDEPYQFRVYGDIDILATYEFGNGATAPAVWEKRCDDGRYVYITLGHDAAAFEGEGLRKLLRNAVAYLTKD